MQERRRDESFSTTLSSLISTLYFLCEPPWLRVSSEAGGGISPVPATGRRKGTLVHFDDGEVFAGVPFGGRF